MLENREESDRKIVIIMLEPIWERLMIDFEIGFWTRTCISVIPYLVVTDTISY